MAERKREETRNGQILQVNGLRVEADFPQEVIEKELEPLLQELAALRRTRVRRIIAFLAGAPGAGKSTLAAFLQQLWASRKYARGVSLQCAGLDGFHFHQDYLERHFLVRDGQQIPLAAIKGAPETFDAARFAKKLECLRSSPSVSWPVYDRRIHDVREDAGELCADILLLEGNWLLLDEEPWRVLAAAADLRVFLAVDPALLQDRLVSRKIRGGMDEESARQWVERSDLSNVRRVLEHRINPDVTIRL